MLNYYDEMKNDIIEALKYDYAEVLKNADNKEDAYYQLEDILFVNDAVTGNASGSYYFSTYKSRKHCYEYFRDVSEALEEYGYDSELENFKTFIELVEEGYLNIENMTLNDEILDEDKRYYVFYALEEVEELNFETIDVITRCYYLSNVLRDVLDNYYRGKRKMTRKRIAWLTNLLNIGVLTVLLAKNYSPVYGAVACGIAVSTILIATIPGIVYNDDIE